MRCKKSWTCSSPSRFRRTVTEPVRDVAPTAPIDRGWVDWAVAPPAGRHPPQRRHPPAAAAHCPAASASTSTSRTSRPTRPAASSTGWPGRCSSTPSATATSGPAARSSRRPAARPRSARRTSPGCSGCRSSRSSPASTSPDKLALDRARGRPLRARRRSAGDVYDVARRLADEPGGHYLDQFTNAERATDWRGNNNIAESIFEQLVARAAPGARVGRGRRGHRRHERDDRPVPALPRPRHPARRRRPAGLGLPARLRRTRSPTRPRLAHRGHRTAAGRAVVRARRSSTG